LSFVRQHRRAILGGLCLLVIVIILISFSLELQNLYRGFLQRPQGDWVLLLDVLFVALLVLACLTSIFPASILGVMAGALFGVAKGFLLSATSFLIAALLAFCFGRYFFREVSRRLTAFFFDLNALEANLTKYDWRYALFVRLTPIAPFGITSYCMGLTPLKLRSFILTTFGTFPFLLVCIYLGSAGGLLVLRDGGFDRQLLWQLTVFFTGGAVAFAAVAYSIPRLARRLLSSSEDVESPVHSNNRDS
jgi:uncharacterized membrane protein YdjX (TVP38/TMEM64 family)